MRDEKLDPLLPASHIQHYGERVSRQSAHNSVAVLAFFSILTWTLVLGIVIVTAATTFESHVSQSGLSESSLLLVKIRR